MDFAERIRLRNRITDKRRAMKNPISKAIRPKGFSCLTYTEQRLLAYLNAKRNTKNKIGQCFIRKNKIVTSRTQAVHSLAEKGIVEIKRVKNNLIYFQLKGKLRQHFSLALLKTLFN